MRWTLSRRSGWRVVVAIAVAVVVGPAAPAHAAGSGDPTGLQSGPAVYHSGFTSLYTVNASNRHLYETYLSNIGAAWVTQDLSAAAGTPAVVGTPTSVTHDGYTSVFTVSAADGHLQETYLFNIGAAWATQDLSAAAGTPPVYGTPAAVYHDGYTSVYTVDSNGHLWETFLSNIGAAWNIHDLSADTGTPPVYGSPAAMTHDGYTSVFTLSTDGHLHETFLARTGGPWVTQDLSTAANIPTATGIPAAVYHGGYTSVFTVDVIGHHLQETYLTNIGAAWVTQDLGGPVLGDLTAIYHNGYTSVFSRDLYNGDLQETYLPYIGAAWNTQDLSSAAGTPAAAGQPAAVTHDGYTSVYTINFSDRHIVETFLPYIGAAWVSQDFTTNYGTPVAAS
jgi:hypothetical protein